MTTLTTPVATITASDLHTLVSGSGEYALVDVRAPRITAEQGSILLGVSIPLSVLELRVDSLIPRRSTTIVVYDGGDDSGLAELGAARLAALGYTDVSVLDGGLAAWAEAGFKVQSGGDHVIGQAFGEWIEEEYGTPHISVPDYLAKVAAGEDIVLLDSRPIGEFENHSLPGGTSIPGAELVYRAAELVKSPDTLVVVNCAGRTRSILGAQVLINAGLPNKIVSLEGGTQSWVLEGHDLDHGKHSVAPLPSGEALESAHEAAQRFRDKFDVKTIDKATLTRFRAEADERSLYVLDVRTPEEFAAGHLPGSFSAPSWDVAPWVFRYISTHNARIVLVDNDQVRATVAGAWIVQFGWGDVHVLEDAFANETLETGPVARTPLNVPQEVRTISVEELVAARAAQEDITVLDLQSSVDYKKGHIPGSSFAIRAQLANSVDAVDGSGKIVLTSQDDLLPRYAAADLSAVTDRDVVVLAGGTQAWEAAGQPLETEGQLWLHEPVDVVRSGWREGDLESQKERFRWYLNWELGLPAELEQDDTVPFKAFPEAR